MHDTLAPVRSLDQDRQSLTDASSRAHVRFVHRLELRVGLWLLLRSARRLDAARDHSEHASRLANESSRVQRDHTALRRHALSGVRT